MGLQYALTIATAWRSPTATRTKAGERAFSVAGPKAWNSLPIIVKSAETHRRLKRQGY